MVLYDFLPELVLTFSALLVLPAQKFEEIFGSFKAVSVTGFLGYALFSALKPSPLLPICLATCGALFASYEDNPRKITALMLGTIGFSKVVTEQNPALIFASFELATISIWSILGSGSFLRVQFLCTGIMLFGLVAEGFFKPTFALAISFMTGIFPFQFLGGGIPCLMMRTSGLLALSKLVPEFVTIIGLASATLAQISYVVKPTLENLFAAETGYLLLLGKLTPYLAPFVLIAATGLYTSEDNLNSAVFRLSFAGIPPTAGFIIRFEALKEAQAWITALLILNFSVSAYLNVIRLLSLRVEKIRLVPSLLSLAILGVFYVLFSGVVKIEP